MATAVGSGLGEGESAGDGLGEGESAGDGDGLGEGDGVTSTVTAVALGLGGAAWAPHAPARALRATRAATAARRDGVRRVGMASAWYRPPPGPDPEPKVLVRCREMGTRTVIGAGLLAGIIVGGLAVGGAIALLPAPPAPVVPTPSPLALETPTPAPTPSASPSASPAPASPSSSPSGPPSSAAASPSQIGDVGFGVGTNAPALRLAKLGGGSLSLADLRGKPVWVNFMATWCPECRDELPLMAGFAARYAKTGLTVVLVDVREPGVDIAGYLASLRVSLPVGLDPDGSAASAWKALALPTHFWVTGDGVIAAGAVGAIGADQMAVNLETILPGVDVTP